MTTHALYVTETPRETWDVPAAGDARFTWEYDEGRARLLALYQKGKDKQWDALDPDRLVAGGRQVQRRWAWVRSPARSTARRLSKSSASATRTRCSSTSSRGSSASSCTASRAR